MNYKKLALIVATAGMVVACGTAPSAPTWSSLQAFVKKNFDGHELPDFKAEELGKLKYSIHNDAGYAEIFGGELESPEPIKTAAGVFEEAGFVDLLADYRDDPEYAEYVSDWMYPMEYRFVVENAGPRYVRVGLSGKLPEPNKAEAEEEPARSFYAQVFDPYDYSWFDSSSSELIAYAFGSAGQTSYIEDEVFLDELVPYTGQSTYSANGAYKDYIDEAIEEVEEDGYLKFYMQDIIRSELDAYVAALAAFEEDAWGLYTYAESEVEPGYLGHLYKLVSPSKYFTMDVYFAGDEAMFLFAKADASIPQVLKAMEPALWLSSEVTAYDFEYFENKESGATGYSFMELSEQGTEPTGASFTSAYAAYAGLVDDEDLDATEIIEFAALSNYQAQGVLDIDDNEVIVYADYTLAGITEDWEFIFYFYWGIEVSSWPTYPVELTPAFLEAAGCDNIHKFFDQDDGSFMFGKEVETADDVEAVYNAIAALDGADVITAYEDGLGRVQLSENKMAVVELLSETDPETSEVSYGYYVTVKDLPPAALYDIAAALEISVFDFEQNPKTGVWYTTPDSDSEVYWEDAVPDLEAVTELLKTVPGMELGEPVVSDEDDYNYGSYVVEGKIGDVDVVYRSVTVGHDDDYWGYYSAQIIYNPAKDDASVTAFFEGVASFLDIYVEFDIINAEYEWGEDYPDSLSFDVDEMEATLREAFPEAEFTFDMVLDDYGDPVITIDFAGYEIEIHVEDWYDYYWVYAYCEYVGE